MPKRDPVKLSPLSSKEAAKRNISRKIEILEEWLRDGIPWEYANNQPVRDDLGCRICVYFPTSLRSFNVWCSNKYTLDTLNRQQSLSQILGNGIDTINKHPSLKERALNLIQALLQIAKDQREFEGPNRIASLELEIKRLKLFITNQATKLVEIQRKNTSLIKEMSVLERKEKGNFEELTRNYELLERQNTRLREEISLLTKQLKNVYSLKEIKNEN